MDERQLLDAYRKLVPDLTEWGKWVDQTILTVLEPFEQEHRLKIQPRFRMKDEPSFISKALYRKKSYTDPLLKIEDKIGTRVVMLTTADVNEVADLLMAYAGWQVKKDRDPREDIENSPNIFDYQSIHLVVQPSKNSGLFDDNVVNLLTCEVQIRTLLQHAYAEVSHDSTYKGPYKNDREIQRKLAKAMALMEATDDYFCEIFTLMTDQGRRYRLYLEELSSRFLSVRPEFTREQTDITLTDLVFELLAQQDVPLSEIDKFMVKREQEIKPCIQANRSLLFRQPVILLIAYLLYEHQGFLKTNWPLNADALQSVMTGFGYSTEVY